MVIKPLTGNKRNVFYENYILHRQTERNMTIYKSQ